jgi:hypothetical protein
MAGFGIATATGRPRPDYARFVKEQAQQGGFSPLFWRWASAGFSFTELALLGHLIGVAKVNAGPDGFMLCTAPFLEKVGMPADQQKALLCGLADKGVLTIKRRPDPKDPERKLRYVRVELGALRAFLANVAK